MSPYTFVDHPSELVLSVRGNSFRDVAQEAVAALASVMESGMTYTGESHETHFTVDGVDRAALLVNLLNEIISRAEAEHFIPRDTTCSLTSASTLDVRVTGGCVTEAPSFVKAATFHRLDVSDRDGVVTATVTFDI